MAWVSPTFSPFLSLYKASELPEALMDSGLTVPSVSCRRGAGRDQLSSCSPAGNSTKFWFN